MKKNKRNSVLLPSKNRPDRIEECLLAIIKFSKISDIDICINNNDKRIDEYFKLVTKMNQAKCKIRIHLTNSKNMVESLNEVALKISNNYAYLTFIGDDQIISTVGWDQLMSKPLENRIGISYPNDLNQGISLPTSVMLNSRIVKHLGYFAVPNFTHLYIDNVWLEMGKYLKNINYFEDVIIEHKHFSIGKSKDDETYKLNNSQMSYAIGLEQFEIYMKRYFKKDMRKLKIKNFFYHELQNMAQNKLK